MTELQSERSVRLEPPVRSEPFWPIAVIVFGLSLTATWVILLAYGLVTLVERVI